MGISSLSSSEHVPHSPGITECFLGVEPGDIPFREQVGSTDFSGLSDAYGSATDAANELERLLGDSVEIRAAERYLLGTVLHQSTSWPVTATVAELLVRGLNDPALRNGLPAVFTFLANVADAPADVGMPMDEDFSDILLRDGVDQRARLADLIRGGASPDEVEDALDLGAAWAYEEIFAHARSWWKQIDRFLAEPGRGAGTDDLPPFTIGLAGFALARLAALLDASEGGAAGAGAGESETIGRAASWSDATGERLRRLLSTGRVLELTDRRVLVRALGNIQPTEEYLEDADRLTRIAAALSPSLARDARALTLLAGALGEAAELDAMLDRPEYLTVLLNLPNMIARLTAATVDTDVLVVAGIGCLRWTRQSGTGLFQTLRFLPRIFPNPAEGSELTRLSPAQCRYLGALLGEGDLFEQFTAAGTAETYRATGLPSTRRGCAKLIRRSERANRA
ncbi:hypothetical protein [Lysinibacter cavernae]|uniref:Uncharacterized protein n=1 Tax=Lysinibacter cavernae TaxID=1640652 RepID=A0A7X5R1D8_9MICO|nr:hypothetical protein [Lysinibacter cavernae]NIH53657.1 hypothetical protein [Lysinibacter cavernae]